MTGTQMALCI